MSTVDAVCKSDKEYIPLEGHSDNLVLHTLNSVPDP
jgi:hypothetical protein